MRIELQRVKYMPKELAPGILYVSEEFGAAAHLCACGCGSKIRTPLGPTDWSFQEAVDGVTLRPSVGNWQQPCRSHYSIRRGEIVWEDEWTPEEVEAGRQAEQERSRTYYEALEDEAHREPRRGLLQRLWRWVKRLFGRR